MRSALRGSGAARAPRLRPRATGARAVQRARSLAVLLALALLGACGEPSPPAGFAEGFEQGRAEGAALGFEEGRRAGHAEGFAAGQSAGGEVGRATALRRWVPLGFALGLLLGAGGVLVAARRPIGEALAVRRSRRRMRRWLDHHHAGRALPALPTPALRAALDAFFDRLARFEAALAAAPEADAAALRRGLEAVAAQAAALHGLRARLAAAVEEVGQRGDAPAAPGTTLSRPAGPESASAPRPGEARQRRDAALERARAHLAACDAELHGLDDLLDHLRLQAANIGAAGDPGLGARLNRALGGAADDLERAVQTAARELVDA